MTGRMQRAGTGGSRDAQGIDRIRAEVGGGWGDGGADGSSGGDPGPDLDYLALVSGLTLNGGNGFGAFVGYSFLDSVPVDYAADYPTGLDTFRPLSDAERDLARQAIAAWGEASGLTFFEVAPQEGDIRFGVYDLGILTPDADEAAFAYLPGIDGDDIRSDVFVDGFYADWYHMYLHEIGHALGLKHPFEGSPILSEDLDNYHHTVMSYTADGEDGNVLGDLDIEAIQSLYGDEDDDGNQIDQWTWDATNRILYQQGDKHANQIIGIGGTDSVSAGAGDDVVITKEGRDSLEGEAGNDSLSAGSGDDVLDGGEGSDTLVGGIGDDLYLVADGRDAIVETADGGHDRVDSTAEAFGLAAGVEDLRLLGGAINGTGNDLANVLTGNALGNRLAGMEGSDTLIGGGGADLLFGGADADVLDGGAGADRLEGGLGADRLIGGVGNDLYIVGDREDQVIEAVRGGRDQVQASVTLVLAAEVEELVLTGTKRIHGTGNGLSNLLTGNDAANRLAGLEGRDTIDGGAGNDTITGGSGLDRLAGGSGRDVFAFAAGDTGARDVTADRILDWATGDRIDLSAVDAVRGGADDAFGFIGGSAFTGHAGELRTFQAGGDTFVAGDANGDGKADLLIVLTGAHDLVAADFVL